MGNVKTAGARPRPGPALGKPRRPRSAGRGDPARRLAAGRMLVVALLVIAGLKLVIIQTIQAPELRSKGDKQRVTPISEPAERGSILDSSGAPLAFSVQADALTANPYLLARDQGANAVNRRTQIALGISRLTGMDPNQLYALLNSDKHYVVLAPMVEPAVARAVTDQFPEIGREDRESRQYPGGPLAANIIGAASWDLDKKKLHGVVGMEASQEKVLAGVDGYRVVDTAEGSNTIIPGSQRAERPAEPGSSIQLTIDSDLQYTLQRQLAAYVALHGAKDGTAVVLDARTGQVRALADSNTFDPRELSTATPDQLGDSAVTTPFEPGSVNKIITMAAALSSGLDTPSTVKTVPGQLEIADRTVHDAWVHGPQQFTLTGILARSSNVGTLLTAQQIGPDRFWDMLQKMGIGHRTLAGLPGESPGVVPPRASWSGSTFGNLPIGQGLSMTVLQLADMYQSVANDGLRIPPRIVGSIIAPDGTRQELPPPTGVRVVSPEIARQLRQMLTAVTQAGHGVQRGTGVSAAVPGYQVAGKTGTAQQVNPACGCYYANHYWITFAGMFPGQSPRYVMAIMLDNPQHGQDAAGLFHETMSYLAQRDHIPASTDPTPMVPLVVP